MIDAPECRTGCHATTELRSQGHTLTALYRRSISAGGPSNTEHGLMPSVDFRMNVSMERKTVIRTFFIFINKM